MSRTFDIDGSLPPTEEQIRVRRAALAIVKETLPPGSVPPVHFLTVSTYAIALSDALIPQTGEPEPPHTWPDIALDYGAFIFGPTGKLHDTPGHIAASLTLIGVMIAERLAREEAAS